MAGIRPKQKVRTKDKTPEWYKANGEWLRDVSNFYDDSKSDMLGLYRAAMGEIDPAYYSYVTNPYNTPEENLRNFPARMRNYDIIIPILNLYLGEKANRPFNHQVIVASPDIVNDTKTQMDQAFLAAMSQDLVNQLNAAGMDTGVPTQEIPEYQEIVNRYKVDISDKRAIFGQEALDFIKYSLAMKDKFLEGMYDWLVTGKVFSYKDVYKNDMLYEIVPPLELTHGTTKTGFVKDADWARRKSRFNLNDVLDRFGQEFARLQKEENIDALGLLDEKYANGDGTGSTTSFNVTYNLDSEKNLGTKGYSQLLIENKGLIEVDHMVWKGFHLVKILHYINLNTGEPEEMEVDEDYQLNPEHGDIEIEEEWMSVTHEIYCIDDLIWVYGRECQVQMNELCNTSKCELPYNGRAGYNERDKHNSIVRQILPYQVLINIYRFRMELIIAKNKEKIMTIPLGLIPNGEGWTEDKFFHYVETMGAMIVDETAPNAVAALNALKAIDMSLGNYIQQMQALVASIKEEAWECIGMNRQRYGDVNSSDGKGTNEQALIRSSVISRELNRRFERWEETELQGLIEYSKLAWIDGKKGAYINSDGQVAMMEVDPDRHLNTDYGIFVVDSMEEDANLRQAKEFAFGAAQKGGVPYSTVLTVIGSKNMSKLKDLTLKAEELTRQYEAEVRKSEQEAAANLQAMKTQETDKKAQTDLQKETIKGEYAVKVALIGQEGNADGQGEEDNIEDRYTDYINQQQDRDSKNYKEGMGAAAKTGEARLKEANLALNKEKVKIMKDRPKSSK